MSKLTTKSYCVNRLRNSGYNVAKLDDVVYTEEDNRKWSIIIDNGVSSILFTCMKDTTIHLYDGDRFLNPFLRIDTDSMDVLIEYLNGMGIVNKHYSYGVYQELEENIIEVELQEKL